MRLYNSLTKSKDEFIAINPSKVTIYVCGITPYDTTHLGHAFTYISFDTLIKYLNYKQFKVEYTQNVTDINDRDNDILKKTQERNTSWNELGQYWTKHFLNDMGDLNWTVPNHYLKASENIASMVDLIKKILADDYAYIVNGSVYLDITKKVNYGKLSRLTKDQMLEKAQEFDEDINNPDKKHPLDITLWRASTSNQASHIPSFPSPFSKGRPGWHLECSAMAISSLGEQIDIHGGGIDLIYPHHESEIAQSEAGTDKVPFVNFWMHTGTVFYQNSKMSKSLGNLVMVSDLLKKYSSNTLRYCLLSHHYRQSWEFKEEELEQANKKLQVITTLLNISHSNKYQTTNQTPDPANALDIDIIKEFENYMNDDLNTPKVLQLMSDLSADLIKNPNGQSLKDLTTIYHTLGFK